MECALDHHNNRLKRLASYATQAQFALASIYDGAAAKVTP